MRSSMGSVTQIEPGRWRVRLFRGYKPGGKPDYASKNVQGTRRDAETELARMVLRLGKSPEAIRKISVYDFMRDVWLPSKTDIRAETRSAYEGLIENHIKRLFGKIALNDLLAYTVTDRLDSIEHKGAAKKVHGVLRQGMKYAARMGMVDTDPMPSVPCPKGKRYEARVLDASEAAAVLEYFRDDRIEAAVLIALSCGLRRSEICALDWQNVTLEKVDGSVRGEISVTRGMHRGGTFDDPKSSRSRRTVSIPGFAAQRLYEIRRGPRIGPLMFNADGSRLTPDALSKRWAYMMSDPVSPVEYIEFKNLRHSHATISLASGVGIVDVSRRLGHSTITVTDAFYLRPGRKPDEDAADSFDVAVRKASGHNGS